jgi:hypothetical protein
MTADHVALYEELLAGRHLRRRSTRAQSTDLVPIPVIDLVPPSTTRTPSAPIPVA